MDTPSRDSQAVINAVRAEAFTIPTDAPESDATLAWDSTILVLVEIEAGGCTGLGYTYPPGAGAHIQTQGRRTLCPMKP